MPKPYDAAERAAVRRRKTAEYGREEVFAVPDLRAYPLTERGRPSRERTLAAWRYLHQRRNWARLGARRASAAARRIRAWAKQHWGLDLTATPTAKSARPVEVYALPDAPVWPLTDRGRPDQELVWKAWEGVHEGRWWTLLGARAEVAEARIAAFARRHRLTLEPPPQIGRRCRW